VVEIARIALGAGHPGTAALTTVLTLPRRVGMVLAYPSGVLAKGAFDEVNNSAPAWVNFT
jgi:hypothetical protein